MDLTSTAFDSLREDETEEDVPQNEAAFYMNTERETTKLTVLFGDGRDVSLELENEGDIELVRTLLADPTFWLQILNSLSSAMTYHK